MDYVTDLSLKGMNFFPEYIFYSIFNKVNTSYVCIYRIVDNINIV